MKKLTRAEEPELQHDESLEEPSGESIARIIPLRSETALSRFPLHRLAKKGIVKKISHRKKDANGKTVTSWEVTNPPGPLAYKVDSIVVSRRIDESRPNIPKLLKLGSLRDICKEIGISPEGKNTMAVKEALRENAFAGITARLDYKSQDKSEKHFEFSDTRYGVIFTGERLPNGNKADAVYINFHDLYLSLLHQSQTRPLDYEYLRVLPPASQRLYQLLSFTIFGALRHGRKHATMLYSELCAAAPLTRYYEWDKGKKQLYKLHKPHIDSGYLAKVEYEETFSVDGRSDWIIRYTPGPKAKREYREFAKRKDERAEEPGQYLLPRLLQAPLPNPESLKPVKSSIVTRLITEGISQRTAQELESNHREECEKQLAALSSRDLSKVRDRAAWLVKAITEGYALPATPEQGSASPEISEKVKKAVECAYCKDGFAPGWRLVASEKKPSGAMKKCTHDPLIEAKYQSI